MNSNFQSELAQLKAKKFYTEFDMDALTAEHEDRIYELEKRLDQSKEHNSMAWLGGISIGAILAVLVMLACHL